MQYTRYDADQLVIGKEQGGWVYGVKFLGMDNDQIRIQGSDYDISMVKKLCESNHLMVRKAIGGTEHEFYVVHRCGPNNASVQVQLVNPGDYLVLDQQDPGQGKPTVIPEALGIVALKPRSYPDRRGTC